MPAVADPTRSLSRAVTLLQRLCNHGRRGWRLSDLALDAGLDLATTHRLLQGLLAGGLVSRVPGSRRYALGPFAWQLGLAAAPWFTLDDASQRRLQAAARALRGTLFLKQRSGFDSVCVARFDGAAIDHALLLEVGGRRPLCQTAGGVSLLLGLPPDQQRAAEADNLARLARQGRSDQAGIRRMLLRSRGWGFGGNLGDRVSGIQAVSWPITAITAATATPADGDAPVVGRPVMAGPPLAALSVAIAATPLAADAIRAIASRLAAEARLLGPLLAAQRG